MICNASSTAKDKFLEIVPVRCCRYVKSQLAVMWTDLIESGGIAHAIIHRICIRGHRAMEPAGASCVVRVKIGRQSDRAAIKGCGGGAAERGAVR